jgi:hypothetical protein
VSRDRSLLHLSKIDAFADWLAGRGWKREPTKGVYEVLRVRKDRELVLFFRHEGGEHATAYARGLRMVLQWLRARPRHAQPPAAPGSRSAVDGAPSSGGE